MPATSAIATDTDEGSIDILLALGATSLCLSKVVRQPVDVPSFTAGNTYV